MYHKFKVGLLIIMIMMGVCGCNMNSTKNSDKNKEEVVLNNRQKEILKEEGLPTSYNELTSSQKSAIISIEEMLKYAEDKYDTKFSYAGYIAKGPLESEQLIAYPTAGSEDEDLFRITKTKDGYEDNYVLIASTNVYESYIMTGIQAFASNITIKIYADLTKTTLETVATNGKEFDNTTEAAIWIFIDGSLCSNEDFYALVSKSEDYLKEHQLYSTVQFVLLREDKINYVTKSNFEDYLTDEFYSLSEEIFIKHS